MRRNRDSSSSAPVELAICDANAVSYRPSIIKRHIYVNVAGRTHPLSIHEHKHVLSYSVSVGHAQAHELVPSPTKVDNLFDGLV